MSNTATVSQRLIVLLRAQQFVQALNELFSDDVESLDPLSATGGTIRGLSKIIELEEMFLSKTTIHGIEISEAIHSGNYFSIQLVMDFSIDGQRKKIDELCVYKLSDGKIIRQQFFIS